MLGTHNVYDGHAQQKLVTPHIQDRSQQLKNSQLEPKLIKTV